MNTPNKRWIWAVVVVCALISLLIVPFETTVVPEWKLRIVDPSGWPVPGISVAEQWRHYSIEFSGHREIRTSDEEGYVLFPRRTIRASAVRRIVGPALLLLNIHGESGPKGSALVLGPYLTNRNPEFEASKPSPEIVVIEPQR
jgi:hypothetical protein